MPSLPRFPLPRPLPSMFAVCGAIALVLVVRSLALGWTLFRPLAHYDYWDFLRSIPHVYDGTYWLHDLFAQHNEHRIVTARLVFILDLLIFDASETLPVTVFYLSLLVIAVLLGRWSTTSAAMRGVIVLAISSLLLSPVQWENFTSGFQVQFPFVDLFVMASCACLIRTLDRSNPRSSSLTLGAAMVFDGLAVFSMASGPLAIGSAAIIGALLRSRRRRLTVYLVAHLAFCGLFFIGYTRSTDIVPTYAPMALIQYALIYLGSCVSGQPHMTLLLGVADIALFVCALGLTFRRAYTSSVSIDRPQVFAVAMLVFIVSWAFLTAHGRASLGMGFAASSRYTLQSLLMQSCLFVFYWREVEGYNAPTRRANVAKAALLCILIAVSASSNLAEAPLDDWRRRVDDLDITGFALVNGVAPDDVLKLVHPAPDSIREPLAFLASHRLSLFSTRFAGAFRPPLAAVASLRLDDLPDCTAQFGIIRAGATGLLMDGWIFEPTHPAADGWILVYDGADQDRLVGFGRQSVERKDVDDALHITARRTGFKVGLASPLFADSVRARPFDVVLVPWHDSRPVCRALAALTEG